MVHLKVFISEGDILMAMNGATIGKIFGLAKTTNRLLLQNYLKSFFPNKKLLKYLYELTQVK